MLESASDTTHHPASDDGGHLVSALALMLFLVPALGVPSERMVQDTLKSSLVSLGVLMIGLSLCWRHARRPEPLYWHHLLWLPVALLTWALGSMLWSHTFLAAVEAVRWFLFALLIWIGLQILRPEHLPKIAAGIHWGAVLAALWAALQFWIDLRVFPQTSPPGATFTNRNFFAEYMIGALPFSVWLAARAKNTVQILSRVFCGAFIVLTLMMTGTRSALVALLALVVLLLAVVWLFRRELALPTWARAQKGLALLVLAFTLLGLGSVPTGNAQLREEMVSATALERSFARVQLVTEKATYVDRDSSVSGRFRLWRASAEMIRANPVAGVGAGAWEVQIPRYQSPELVEDDYYAHNEPLQLVAEYGVVGWLFLIAFGSYLLYAASRTWLLRDDAATDECGRAIALASLLSLSLVSVAGFPWHLAGTGALFALNLAILAASDVARSRAMPGDRAGALCLRWDAPRWVWRALAGSLALCLSLAISIAWQAMLCESHLVRAVQIAKHIAASGRPNAPEWNDAKAEMFHSLREGIAINPHYRSITGMAADQVGSWGDWQNLRWILESVLSSRPYIVAMLVNVGRAHSLAGELSTARGYLERARAVQPKATSVHALDFELFLRAGDGAAAAERVRDSMAQGLYDAELLTHAYQLGLRRQDWALAIQALTLRNQGWPARAVDGWLRIASIYSLPQVQDEERALQAYQSALAAVPPVHRERLIQQIPEAYRSRLRSPPPH